VLRISIYCRDNGPKYTEVMNLTFPSHVTLSVTRPTIRHMPFPSGGPMEPSVNLQPYWDIGL